MPNPPPQSENKNGGILLFIDGTWQHAKEMIKDIMVFHDSINSFQISLPYEKNTKGHNMWNFVLIL